MIGSFVIKTHKPLQTFGNGKCLERQTMKIKVCRSQSRRHKTKGYLQHIISTEQILRREIRESTISSNKTTLYNFITPTSKKNHM